jgi:hypothetical protein
VQVERRVETRRPDILLLDGDRVVGAVEVWVSHRVEGDKQALFATWEVPWAEVSAEAVQIETDSRWNPQSPLPIAASGPCAQWTCATCVEAARVRAEEQARQKALRDKAEARDREERLAREAAMKAAAQAEKERRTAFSRGVERREAEQRQEGMLIVEMKVFDTFDATGHAHRDALVIADVYRGGKHAGAFLGVLGTFEVLKKVPARLEEEGYGLMKEKADEYLQSRTGAREVIDCPIEWFSLPSVLDNDAFYDGWTWEGMDHRWPSEELPPSQPWRLNAADERVDCLDLLRFFFVRYLSGLPVRYRWSKNKAKWFQTAIDREEVWRLWPEVPSPRNPG